MLGIKNRSDDERFFRAYQILAKNTLFLEGANRLRRECHSNFLTINDESLFLKIRLEYTLGTAQRKADIIAMHFAFAGDFAS